VSKPDLILCVDHGSRDVAVALVAAIQANGDIVILDMQELKPPAIDSTCFEVEQQKLLPSQEPWYRKFDKRPRR
jgi:hypothetical protein